MAIVMAMPEASVHEYQSATLSENQIGPARKFLGVKAVAIARAMEQLSDSMFGLCVFPFDPPHHAATFFGTDDIRHQARL